MTLEGVLKQSLWDDFVTWETDVLCSTTALLVSAALGRSSECVSWLFQEARSGFRWAGSKQPGLVQA